MISRSRRGKFQPIMRDVQFSDGIKKSSKYRPVRAPNGVAGGPISAICQTATTPVKHRTCFVITCSCDCHMDEVAAEL